MVRNGNLKCGTCPWYEPNSPDPGAGVCMFNPPVPLPVPVNPNLVRPGQGGLQAGAAGLRPPTLATQRCHHHPDWHKSLQ